jgi:hypothetical protein
LGFNCFPFLSFLSFFSFLFNNPKASIISVRLLLFE